MSDRIFLIQTVEESDRHCVQQLYEVPGGCCDLTVDLGITLISKRAAQEAPWGQTFLFAGQNFATFRDALSHKESLE